MKKRILYVSIVLGVILIFTSCYTVSTLETDVLIPAKNIFPSEIYRVGVVSRMDMDRKSKEEREDKAKIIEFQRDSILLKNAVLSLLDGLSESPRFEAYYITPRRTLKADDASLQNPLNWDNVDSLAKKDTLDLLISLEAAHFKDSVYRRSDIKKMEFSDSIINSIRLTKELRESAVYEAYLIFPHLYWRLYYIERKEMGEDLYIDSLIYPAGSNRGYPGKEKIIQYYYESLGDAAYRYSHDLAPRWKTEGRAWFPNGDIYFMEAAELANDGKWEEASEIWKNQAYQRNKNVAAKASLNMAVAAEMLDKLDLAITWVERAEELGLKYYPKEYKKILEKRIEVRKILDFQMK